MIGLIACCSRKLRTPARARDLYQSPLFRLSRTYVEQRCEQWVILSAKHGLVFPDEVVEPYDQALADLDRLAWVAWCLSTRQQIVDRLDTQGPFLVLAGARYQGAVTDLPVVDPLQGLPIGKQLAFLKQAVQMHRSSRRGLGLLS